MASAAYNSRAYKEARARLLADNPVCYWCRKAPATTADHLIEVDRGGERDLDSMVAACQPCNSKRGAAYRNAKHTGIQRRRAEGMQRSMHDHARSELLEPKPQDPAAFPSVSLEQGKRKTSASRRIDKYSDRAHEIEPRLVTADWGQESYLDEAVELARMVLGLELEPWQKLALDMQLQHDGSGDLLTRTFLGSVGRQNGKTVCIKVLLLWALLRWPSHRGAPVQIISTAHALNLAEAVFSELTPILEERFAAEAYWSSGRQSVTMPDGSKWIVQAARPASFHGYSPTLVIADEIWNIKEEIINDGAIPAQRAQRAPLLSMWSTAGTLDSHLFRRYREQGLRAVASGEPGPLAFLEYSPRPDANINDPATWRAANPANFIPDEVLAEEARDPANRSSWMRSSLNMWIATAQGWLEPGFWQRQEADNPTGPPRVLAVEVDVDGGIYGGVFAWPAEDGSVHVNTAFVESTVEAMWRKVEQVLGPTTQLVVGASLELAIPTHLKRRSTIAGYGEITKWTGPIRVAIMEQRLTHGGDPILSEHVARAVSVKVNNGSAITLSTKQSPGCIILCRALIWAAALCLKTPAHKRPQIVVSRR